MNDCECKNWCDLDLKHRIITGHHVSCAMSPDYTKCLEDLVDTMLRNIEYWGHEEDGIHEKLWPSYVQAKAAIQGIFVTDGDEGGYN